MQVKAKKALGQNFLKDDAALGRIVESAAVGPTDWVVEIGPGTGALTRLLSEKAEKVVAVELDRDLIPVLLKQFPLSGNVSIVEGDIMRTDMMQMLRVNGLSEGWPYKVVANIPYYITAPIIQYLLKLPTPPETIVLMIQKEVAERVTALAGDMSILAVAAQYYADTEFLFTVPRTAFDPVPKVDSAVVLLKPKRNFDKEKDKAFFRIVKAGFSARRKTLANNLASSLHLSKEEVTEKLAEAGLSADVRAQALSISDWEKIAIPFTV